MATAKERVPAKGTKGLTGFAGMPPAKRAEASRKGGLVAAERRRAGLSKPHTFTSDEARRAALKRHGKS